MEMYELKKHFATLVLSAFALAVGFFWYDAIKEMLIPITEGASGWVGLTIVAIIITLIAIGVAWLMQIFLKEKTECEKKHGSWKDLDWDYREE
jgi:hypothetical protein